MISVICVYNDRAALERMLLPSLRRQSAKFEEILVDNSGGRYPSAAAALNEAGERARGDYLMVVHQDISFEDEGFLDAAEKSLGALGPFGAAGVAGRGPDFEDPLTAISCGDPPWRPGLLIAAAAEVQTVDECLFFVPAGGFARLRFDEAACAGWHLYAVDYCLSAREGLGLRTFVLPLVVHHYSNGVLDGAYWRSLESVLRKHRGSAPRLYTTVGVWASDFPALRVAYYRAERYLYWTPLGQRLARIKRRIEAASA
jgi:hypothetical protein